MKRRIWSALLGVFLLLTLGLTACQATISTGQDPPIPHVTQRDRGWVDPTGRVSASTLEALRQQSDVFETEGFQLAGVFFSDVASDPSKIASDFGNENGIGSASKDNGLVILVLLDRQGTDGNKPYIFVAPGKGLEGLLNDAKVTRFRDAYFNPLRAQGQWEQGLVQLSSKFAQYLKNPEAQAFSDASLDRTAQSQQQQISPWLIVVFVVVFVVLLVLGIIGAVRGRKFRGPGGGWGGPWISFPGGGGSFGGGGGGGSYGGGGSFGGGGSGG